MYMAIEKHIPIKGAIAFGKYTYKRDRSIHFGQPLIDAFELQEELQLYGAVLHHTIEEPLSTFSMTNSSYIVKIPTPMKFIKVNQYLVDWIQIAKHKGINPKELIRNLYSGSSDNSKIYVDNTLEFVNRVKIIEVGRKQQEFVSIPLSLKNKREGRKPLSN